MLVEAKSRMTDALGRMAATCSAVGVSFTGFEEWIRFKITDVGLQWPGWPQPSLEHSLCSYIASMQCSPLLLLNSPRSSHSRRMCILFSLPSAPPGLRSTNSGRGTCAFRSLHDNSTNGRVTSCFFIIAIVTIQALENRRRCLASAKLDLHISARSV